MFHCHFIIVVRVCVLFLWSYCRITPLYLQTIFCLYLETRRVLQGNGVWVYCEGLQQQPPKTLVSYTQTIALPYIILCLYICITLFYIYRIIVTKSCPPCTYVMLFYLISSVLKSFICVLSVCHDKSKCTIFIIMRYNCRCDQLL